MKFELNKKRFKDEKGRYIVQGLFLEDRYNTNLAVYTLDGEHKEYKGVIYPSLKQLYLEEGDINEWAFATKHLFDWPHWQRLCRNKWLQPHIEQWRDELALSLRSEGIATLVNLAINENSYQAAKWLADEGWIKNRRGRPSQKDIDKAAERKASIEKEFEEDFKLLHLVKGDK